MEENMVAETPGCWPGVIHIKPLSAALPMNEWRIDVWIFCIGSIHRIFDLTQNYTEEKLQLSLLKHARPPSRKISVLGRVFAFMDQLENPMK
jgi:hypothetical protein